MSQIYSILYKITPLNDLQREEEAVRNELQEVQRDITEEDDVEDRAKLLKKETQIKLKLASATARLELCRAENEPADPKRIEKLKNDWVVEKLRYDVHMGKLENPGDPELKKKEDEIERLVKEGFGGGTEDDLPIVGIRP